MNITKAEELVFSRPHAAKFDMLYILDRIVQEHIVKLLVVFFSDKLSFEKHVNFVPFVLKEQRACLYVRMYVHT